MHANRLPRRGAHNRIAILAVLAGIKSARHLAAHEMRERLHLRLHLCHLVAHIQNNFDPRQVHAQLARQIQNHLEPLQVLIRIKPRISLRTRRRQQSYALVQAQCLRMQLVQLRHRADHVTGLRSFPGTRCHETSPQTVARENISRRGSSGSSLLNSFSKFRTRSSSGFGTTICTSTIWSPRFPGCRIEGAPFSRRRSFLPLFVAGGMRTCARPSIVGTSTFDPSDASVTVTGTTVYRSSPRRSKNGCGSTFITIYRSPGGPPCSPALPRPATRTREPVCAPGGMRTSSDSTRGTRPSPPQFLHIVCKRPVPPQRWQATWNFILPLTWVTRPEP